MAAERERKISRVEREAVDYRLNRNS